MQELDDDYLRLYWPLIGGSTGRTTMSLYTIDLSEDDMENIDAIRKFVNAPNDDPNLNRLVVAHMKHQAKTINGVVKIALATAAEEARKWLK